MAFTELNVRSEGVTCKLCNLSNSHANCVSSEECLQGCEITVFETPSSNQVRLVPLTTSALTLISIYVHMYICNYLYTCPLWPLISFDSSLLP